MQRIMRFLPTGEVRSLWHDDLGATFRDHGFQPRRASRVEVVEESGKFHVDFTPLFELTGDDSHRCCLTELFDNYSDAVQAEQAWLITNYIGG